jgi:hypothetical protein
MTITIQNIEHVAWAKRIIITWYIDVGPTDPDHGNWEYLLSSCGYKNVCDEEWIVMEPNIQHPQHTDVIVAPGTNVFVWDYGGVKGLEPKDFDATHSYVVQIALVDSGCGWIDPCLDSNGEYKYKTASGATPIGAPNTKGDNGDLYNNCGDGYELLEDEFGCLYCSPVPPNGGAGQPPITGEGGVVIQGRYMDPWFPGGGWGRGPITPTRKKPTDPGDGTEFTPTPEEYPGDGPDYDPPTPGGGGPIVVGGDDDNGGGGSRVSPEISGVPPDRKILDIYLDEGLGSNIALDSIEGISREGGWLGTTNGGREADWNNINGSIDGMNAKLPSGITKYTRESSSDIPSQSAGLNISPKNVPSVSRDISINSSTEKDRDKNSSSKITDAIVSNGDIFTLNAGNDSKHLDNINPPSADVKASRSVKPANISAEFIDSTARRDNSKDRRELINRGSQLYKRDSGGSVRSNPLSDRSNHAIVRGAGEVVRIKNTPDFESRYNLKLISTAIGVNRVFVDCRLNITPRASKLLRLSVYISQDKIDYLLGETVLRDSSDPRIVSLTRPVGKLKGGKHASVYAVVDDGTNIIGRKFVQILLPDSNASTSKGSRLTINSNKQGNPAESLIRSSSSIELILNSSNMSIVNARTTKPSLDGILELGAYTSTEKNLGSSIEIYNAADIAFLPGSSTIVTFSSKPLVDSLPNGISITGNKHSSVVYKSILAPSELITEGDIVILVRSKSAVNDTITLSAGPDILIKTPLIPSPPTKVSSDGTVTLSFTDLPLLNTLYSVYESGGNNVTPEGVTTYEFTSDLSGVGSINLPATQVPIYFGLAVNDTGSLFKRTIKWFKIG